MAAIVALATVVGTVRATSQATPAAEVAHGVLGALDAAVPEAEDAAAPPQASGAIRFSVQVVEPTYTVVSADSLFSIAQRHSTTIDAIQSINNLPDRSTLSVGQRLIIP